MSEFQKYPNLSVMEIFHKVHERFGTRKAEVLKSLVMKNTAKEKDTNDILQTFR